MKMPGLRITSTAGEESGRSGKSAAAGAGEALRFANGAVLTDADLDAVSGSMWMSNVGEAMFGMNGGSPAGALAGAAECAVLGALYSGAAAATDVAIRGHHGSHC
jgi:hypothetical protein